MVSVPRVLAVLATAVAGVALSVGAWQAATTQAEDEARRRFDTRVDEIVAAMRDRMVAYEQVLRGTAGLFAAARAVEPGPWNRYLDALQVQASYPGIVGVGYAPWRERSARVRYFHPPSEQNRRAIGFDMSAEPVRRRAIDLARDTGAAALTARLTLAQDEDAGSAGVVMVLPLYATQPHDTVAERRNALSGFVYGAFRVADLVRGTVGDTPGIALRLLDVSDPGEPVLLYDDGASRPVMRFVSSEVLPLRGRAWRLEAGFLPGFDATDRPRLVLTGGLALSLLLTLLVWSLLNTREHARDLARRMTRDADRLALAVESSGLALFDWDLRTNLVHLGREWPALLGRPPAAMVTPVHKLEQLVHPNDLPGLREQVRRLLAGEADRYRVEHRVRNARGDWLWIESVARVTERDRRGRALRVTGTNADITERKALGDLKNAFLANVSHELRTPLASIVASLELLHEGAVGDLPEEARRFVEMARGNSERLSELINDLLDLERVESGRLHLAVEAVDVARALGEVAELNASYAARRDVRIAAPAPEPGLAVQADARRLQQVLTNLVSNAAKASPPGSEVVVTARRDGARVVFSVADQGPGIPEGFRARLFGKFEQAEHGKGGTGLGLAICKQLVEKMGGRIWHAGPNRACSGPAGPNPSGDGADERPGSVFCFELPAAG